MRLWSIPHCTRADCLLLRSLKGQEPAPSGCRELPLELHGADRGHSLHPDRVRDPAPLRVAQPHGPAQSHGKWDPSRAPDRRWGRENKGFCSGDVAVAGKPHCCLFSHGPGWVSPRVCIPALPTLGARPQVRAGCSVCVGAALGSLDPAPQAWLSLPNWVFDRTKAFVLSLPRSARNPAPLLALPTSPLLSGCQGTAGAVQGGFPPLPQSLPVL